MNCCICGKELPHFRLKKGYHADCLDTLIIREFGMKAYHYLIDYVARQRS